MAFQVAKNKGRRVFRVHLAHFRKHWRQFLSLCLLGIGSGIIFLTGLYSLTLDTCVLECGNIWRPLATVSAGSLFFINLSFLFYWWLSNRLESLTLRENVLTYYQGLTNTAKATLYLPPLILVPTLFGAVFDFVPWWASGIIGVFSLPIVAVTIANLVNGVFGLLPIDSSEFRRRMALNFFQPRTVFLHEVGSVYEDCAHPNGRSLIWSYGRLTITLSGGADAIIMDAVPSPGRCVSQIIKFKLRALKAGQVVADDMEMVTA